MNILISNDDGVNAPGIRSLASKLREKHNVVVVAPLQERSTTGHTLSLDAPLRVQKVEDQVYGCSGFPSDCVFMGLGHLCGEMRPELVISGINKGANLGQDLYYSGTVAAAREASFHGVRSIAVSLVLSYEKRSKEHYDTAANFVEHFLDQKIHQSIPEMSLININVPNLGSDKIKGVEITKAGIRDYSEDIDARIDSRNREYFWVAGLYRGHREIGGTDCEAIQKEMISVNPQQLIESVPCDFSALKDQIRQQWPKA